MKRDLKKELEVEGGGERGGEVGGEGGGDCLKYSDIPSTSQDQSIPYNQQTINKDDNLNDLQVCL